MSKSGSNSTKHLEEAGLQIVHSKSPVFVPSLFENSNSPFNNNKVVPSSPLITVGNLEQAFKRKQTIMAPNMHGNSINNSNQSMSPNRRNSLHNSPGGKQTVAPQINVLPSQASNMNKIISPQSTNFFNGFSNNSSMVKPQHQPVSGTIGANPGTWWSPTQISNSDSEDEKRKQQQHMTFMSQKQIEKLRKEEEHNQIMEKIQFAKERIRQKHERERFSIGQFDPRRSENIESGSQVLIPVTNSITTSSQQSGLSLSNLLMNPNKSSSQNPRGSLQQFAGSPTGPDIGFPNSPFQFQNMSLGEVNQSEGRDTIIKMKNFFSQAMSLGDSPKVTASNQAAQLAAMKRASVVTLGPKRFSNSPQVNIVDQTDPMAFQGRSLGDPGSQVYFSGTFSPHKTNQSSNRLNVFTDSVNSPGHQLMPPGMLLPRHTLMGAALIDPQKLMSLEQNNFALGIHKMGDSTESLESSIEGVKNDMSPSKAEGDGDRSKSDISIIDPDQGSDSGINSAPGDEEYTPGVYRGGNTVDDDTTDDGTLGDDDEEEDSDDKKYTLGLLLDDQLQIENLPGCVIHPQAGWKTIWNIIMLLLIIFLTVTVPYRIPFEDNTPDEWLYMDIIVDFLFIIDVMLNFFTAMEDDNGELIADHRKIVMSYAKSWFLVDVMSSVPISLIQRLTAPAPGSGGEGGTNVMNVRIIKLSRLPRLYRLLRLLKLMRLYRSNKFIEMISMHLNMSVTTSRLMKSFIMVFFLIHLIGCLWVTVAVLNPFDDDVNWQSANNLQDSDNIAIYIAACYWAAVSIYTVGYGDITSQNNFELFCNIIILFIGITMYTYIFSQLSALFSSVSQQDNESNSRERIIADMAQEHQFPNELTKRMIYFFSQNSYLISLSKEYGIDQLLVILPPHLKGELAQFLYREAIERIRVLQDREMRFYGDYMSKFEPMSIKAGSIFAKEGQGAQEVFFLIKGCVECINQNKFFLEGTVFGETDIIRKRNRLDTYKARGDCYLLKLDKVFFEQLLNEFADFRADIQQMVLEREKKRLEIYQQSKLKKVGIVEKAEFSELKKMVTQVDFAQIRQQHTSNFMKRTAVAMNQSKASFSFVSNGGNGTGQDVSPDTFSLAASARQDGTNSGIRSILKQQTSLLKPLRFNSQNSQQIDGSRFSPVNGNNSFGYKRGPSSIFSKIEGLKNQIFNKDTKNNTDLEYLPMGTIGDQKESINKSQTVVMIHDNESGGTINLHEDASFEDSQRKKNIKMEGFTTQLRESLERLSPNGSNMQTKRDETHNQQQTGNNLMPGSSQKQSFQKSQTTQKAQKNLPFEGGQEEDKHDSDCAPSKSISADESVQQTSMFMYMDALEEEEVQRLSDNIQLCLRNISHSKELIQEYTQLFDSKVSEMGEDANEITKKHFSQGRNCLQSYLSITSLIERLINGMEFPKMQQQLTNIHQRSTDYEKRYYFLENRVKMVTEIVQRRLKTLERERQRMLVQKPLIVKKNPLLDQQRDEKHNKMHQRLVDRSPCNM